MSLPNDYASILNDLNRDVIRHRPADPLQFCADWFNARLRDERRTVVSGAGIGAGSAAARAAAAAAATDLASPFAAVTSSSFAGPDDVTMVPSTQSSFSNANPFAAAGSSASQATPSAAMGAPAAPSALARAPGAAASAAPFQPPANFNFGRRTSVSAESMAPTSSPSSTPSQSEPLTKTVIPKSDSQMHRIRASIQNNLLFRNLDEEQERDVLFAMKEMSCEPNTIVIRQGDQGDYFYVVESGSLDVYIKNDTSSTRGGVMPVGRGSAGSILSSDSDGPATTHLGSSVAPGTDLSASLGDRKVSYGPSDAFGELALLYMQPRAASIVSTSTCVLWALDRVTFRSILMETNSRKRAQLEKFLRDVHLFDSLDSAQLAKLADALEFRDYAYGDKIIEQGERGTEFFIVVDGMVSVRKRRAPSVADEEACGSLITGEYFGGACMASSCDWLNLRVDGMLTYLPVCLPST